MADWAGWSSHLQQQSLTPRLAERNLNPPDSRHMGPCNPGRAVSSGPRALINRDRRPNGTGNGLNLSAITRSHLEPEPPKSSKAWFSGRYLPAIDPAQPMWPEGPPFALTNRPHSDPATLTTVTILLKTYQVVLYAEPTHPAKVTPSWSVPTPASYEGDPGHRPVAQSESMPWSTVLHAHS